MQCMRVLTCLPCLHGIIFAERILQGKEKMSVQLAMCALYCTVKSALFRSDNSILFCFSVHGTRFCVV